MCHPDDQTHFLPFRIALRKTIVCMNQNWAISLAKQGINLGCQKKLHWLKFPVCKKFSEDFAAAAASGYKWAGILRKA